MSDRPAQRILAALEDPTGWLITQAGLDLLREVASREHDVEAFFGSRRREPSPTHLRAGPDDSIAVLDVRGPMTRYASMFSDVSGLSSTQVISDTFAMLDQDDDVKHIVVRYDTPGGQVSGLADFADRIHDAATPVTSYASDMAASAGYWLGSQAGEVVVSPTAIVGSIGVAGRAPRQPMTDQMVSRNAPAKFGDRAASQAVLDALEQQFHEVVARGRGVTAEVVAQDFGRGAVFVGRDAVTAGLADRVATFDQIIAGIAAGITGASRPTTKGTTMSTEVKDGGESAATAQALADAREEGRTAGLSEAQAAHEAALATTKDEAATAERTRVLAIVKAASDKPIEAVLAVAENAAITVEQAAAITGAMPDAKPASALDAALAGTNPDVGHDAPLPADNNDQAKADALWASHRDADKGAAA